MTPQIIDVVTSITEIIKELPLEKQKQVLDFVQFLASKLNEIENNSTKLGNSRIAGLHQGQGWVSEDFNDPLTEADFLELT